MIHAELVWKLEFSADSTGGGVGVGVGVGVGRILNWCDPF